ncbi:flagellar hook-associated protein FlgK [Rheinheimera sp. A13L]|uniref:flagellar hook-associated protein FlgK n=1 Tax=Rheinheimera sp. A13L TaxID=506534 RepID=UPI00021255F0|nr:flagellar hook-associated protein FlgK [Rheinheimera sp. A13L]EGM78250.1 flagellar hook-associated protein FlgK [Rheinheimera sp. A13L]
MSDNLLRIGTSAILASTALLSTTSNNIANLNTPGYSRQRTEFESNMLGLGVGRGTTERLVNDFAQKQMWRDTSSVSYANQYLSEASRVDALLSDQSNSISTGMSSFFSQLQTAINDPTNAASRQLVMGSAQTLLNRFNTLSNQMTEQNKYISQQLETDAQSANEKITVIAQLNQEILAYGNNPGKPPPLDLLDKRDQAIKELSGLVDINVLDAANGDKQIFLSSGQSLVIENGKFSLFSVAGNPDPNRKTLQLRAASNPNVLINVSETQLGGKIGGSLQFRTAVLDPAQKELGQLALAFTDAFNTQNRLGMNADGNLGGDLFTLPTFAAWPFSGNTGAGTITASVAPGQGKNIPANDVRITFTAADAFTVEAVDASGNVIPGTAISRTGVVFPVTVTSDDTNDFFGLNITLANGAPAFAAGDRFDLRPLSNAAQNISLATNRPEALAFASPLKGEKTLENLGNAEIDKLSVSSVGQAGNRLSSPANFTDGPISVTYLGNNQFLIEDAGAPVVSETVTYAGTDYQNLLGASTNFNNAGFDFSVKGVPQVGDTFSVDYNTGGFEDNRNGLLLGNLQNADMVRINAASTVNADKYQTFNQAYSELVGFVGTQTSQARVTAASSKSLLEQTTAWHESLSGVSLDEEAADLVRFQQTYAAAAKILSTSQTIFDTLLQAAR